MIVYYTGFVEDKLYGIFLNSTASALQAVHVGRTWHWGDGGKGHPRGADRSAITILVKVPLLTHDLRTLCGSRPVQCHLL
jgi:hypothetical protein